ncbi:MAG: DNA-protecting protein DprA [Proteobacteria bacterium]|mgnify:CR=1 FL=1|jgi:DNA processing protein|nr:DNA-protecting protein DprA [Pseudomonadota bacterium]
MEKICGQGASQLTDWVTFYCLRGVSEQRKIAMMAVGSTPEDAVLAEPQQWLEWFPDLKKHRVRVSTEAVERVYRWLDRTGGNIITFADARFPTILKEQAAPPILLFAQGQLENLGKDRIGFVGSRRATPGGIAVTQKLVQPLAQAGITIVSGLALGIDVAAHKAALGTRGNTIAVLGTGPDVVYPERNRRTFEKILQTGGVILSEYLPGSGPAKQHFPRRNRIISGLSHAVVVVEAALKSGSLITARIAAEQGRLVCAVPGSALSPVSAGCHQLLRNGATLVSSADHIFREVFPNLEPSPQRKEVLAESLLDFMSGDQKLVLELIDYDSTSIESLVCRSGLTADKVSSILIGMEFDQVVARKLDGTYTRLH